MKAFRIIRKKEAGCCYSAGDGCKAYFKSEGTEEYTMFRISL